MPEAPQPHLLVSISAHGYGHAAQTIPVLNALCELMPSVLLTIRSEVPLPYLQERIRGPFRYLREAGDPGILMSSALDVRAKDTASAYQKLHRDWGLRISNEARLLRELKPDFVLSNVGYLPLAGAHLAGIPCAGMSSLNWSDLFTHYCASLSGTHHVNEQIRRSYANANAFLQLTPGMPMPHLDNRIRIGPVAHLGMSRREEINQRLGLTAESRLVLVSLGGIRSHIDIDDWPELPHVTWLVQANWHSAHPNAVTLESLNMPFADLLASADALICKPGYGSFVEAACANVPVLYVSRADWPETPCLAEWLEQFGTGREISRQQLESGHFEDALNALWSGPGREPVQPTGNREAAQWLASQLASSHG